jgi:hypothetical protein
MGHGMESIIEELLKDFQCGDAMLSPRNFHPKAKHKLPEDKAAEYAAQLHRIGDVNIYFDPQMYTLRTPKSALQSFRYWSTANGDLDARCGDTLTELMKINNRCDTSAIILPSHTAAGIDSDWRKSQQSIINKALEVNGGRPTYATVALNADILRDQSQVDAIVLEVENWDVDGVYIVCEHPNKTYLTDEPLWLLNYLVLIAGLKRTGKKVMAGYGSHQMLILGLAKCDVMFSGSFLNVRRFETSTFEEQDNNSPSRRAVWYYAPKTFSEFKIQTLDLAWQAQQQSSVRPLAMLQTPYPDDRYALPLFRGARPTSTNYGESESFKHYLFCLNKQTAELTRETYDETLAAYRSQLQVAEQLIDVLDKFGIHDRDRNFANSFPVAYQALSSFDQFMGFVMRQEWNRL